MKRLNKKTIFLVSILIFSFAFAAVAFAQSDSDVVVPLGYKTEILATSDAGFLFWDITFSPIGESIISVAAQSRVPCDSYIAKISLDGFVSKFADICIDQPNSLAFGPDTGNLLFFADVAGYWNYVYIVPPNGASTDVQLFASKFVVPLDLAFSPSGDLYLADVYSGTVYKINSEGEVDSFVSGFTMDTSGYPSRTGNWFGITFDSNGDLFVADGGAGAIYKVSQDGIVSTFASGFDSPSSISFSPDGDLFVADSVAGTVYAISPDGIVSTFASGFKHPLSLSFGLSGDLYVLEWESFEQSWPSTRIIKISGFPNSSYDSDGDGALDDVDNCLAIYNPDQLDSNNDGIGDACTDSDNDGVFDAGDNCSSVYNPDQFDLDNDSIGDACDNETNIATSTVLQAGEYTFKDLIISNNSVLTLNSDISLEGFKGVKIIAEILIVEEGSSISADGKGYSAGEGPGAGKVYGNIGYGSKYSGGGYGGKGGDIYSFIHVSGGSIYGSATTPEDLGSGGGNGAGGGAIKLIISNNLTLDGTISASGEGVGSGGSVYIITNTLNSSGSIKANGGNGLGGWHRGSQPERGGYGGGGGRIAVYYQTSNFDGNVEARGGTSGGEDGTVALIDTPNNDLYTGHSFRFQENDSPFNFSKVVLDNSKVNTQGNFDLTANELTANNSDFTLNGTTTKVSFNTLNAANSKLTLQDSLTITISNSLSLNATSSLSFTGSQSLSVSTLILDGDSTLTLSGNEALVVDNIALTDNSIITHSPEGKINLITQNLTIDSISSISADGKGYPAEEGPGAGKSVWCGSWGSGVGSGGGYGGKGGNTSHCSLNGGFTYGSAITPEDLGSGGGFGAGGGAIKIIVSDTFNINGAISANGDTTGSGGSIYIITNNLAGSGSITANGGDSHWKQPSGGGGGGRIATYYQTSSFSGITEAKGSGTSYRSGEDGTVVFIDTLNNNLYTGHSFRFQENDNPFNFNKVVLNNSKVSTEGNISLIADDLIIENNSDFSMGGATSTIAVNQAVINNNSKLTLQDSPTIAISDSLSLNATSSLTFNGAQSLSVPIMIFNENSTLTLSGNEALVVDEIILTDNSTLTHTPQGKVNLIAKNLTIDPTSSISADGKGYSAGEGPGAGKSVWCGSWGSGVGSGGGYGGNGGDTTYCSLKGGSIYGSVIRPEDLGSGGGFGAGGGAIKIIVSDTFNINGAVSANGNLTGSGGSVYIIISNLTGSGLITANGGDGWERRPSGGGGGGRIAVYYQTSNFDGNVETRGGTSGGEDGTVKVQGPSLDAPLTFSLDSSEKVFIDSTLTEKVLSQKGVINNVAVTGDLSGTLNFTDFEMTTIKTGSFAGKGFLKSKWQANLEGIDYKGDWQGMFFLKEAERKIYLKGTVSGEISGIVEGYLTESISESGIYDQYQATWKLNRIGTQTVSATINLTGTINYQENIEYPLTTLYVSQISTKGTAFGYYNGPIETFITQVRIADENNPYNRHGFLIISYDSDSGSGEGWTYDKNVGSGRTDLKGQFTEPLLGFVSGSLIGNEFPRDLFLTIQRGDLGLPPEVDLKVSIQGPTIVRAGRPAYYTIKYRNDGQKATNEAIIFTLIDQFKYISSSQEANYDDFFNLVDWNLGNIAPKTTGSLTLKLNTPTSIGTNLKISAYIIDAKQSQVPQKPENIVLNGIFMKPGEANPPGGKSAWNKFNEFASSTNSVWPPIYYGYNEWVELSKILPDKAKLAEVKRMLDAIQVQVATPGSLKYARALLNSLLLKYPILNTVPTILQVQETINQAVADGKNYIPTDYNGLTRQAIINHHYKNALSDSGGTRSGLTAHEFENLTSDRLIMISPISGLQKPGAYKHELEKILKEGKTKEIVIYQSQKDRLLDIWGKPVNWLVQVKFNENSLIDKMWLDKIIELDDGTKKRIGDLVKINPETLELNGKQIHIDKNILNQQDHWGIFLCINNVITGKDCEEATVSSEVISSMSPEDKYGPIGFDHPDTPPEEYKHFVLPNQNFQYLVDFWNKEDATAPAQEVFIQDQLDSNLDWDTFKFKEFGFLDWVVKLEPWQQSLDTVNVNIDTRPQMDLIVNVKGDFNAETGEIEWTFRSLDPETMEIPENPMAGFLPPITERRHEIGWVVFSVNPKPHLTTGTQISNQAFVKFDFGPWNPAPKEGPFINTIDATLPVSSITEALLEENKIQLSWIGDDQGSGIKDFTIYISEDDMPYEHWLSYTTDNSAVFIGEPGHVYSFYSIARDNVGNFEEVPIEPDMIISTFNAPPIADTSGPYEENESSPVIFDGSVSYDPDGDALQYRWDFDNNGNWDTEWLDNATTTFTWDDDYQGVVKLEVGDGELTDTATATVIILNVPPTAEAGPNQEVIAGDTVYFDGSFTDVGQLDTHTIKWDFGDGIIVENSDLNPLHIYYEKGIYTVTLTIEDDDEGIGEDTLIINVQPIPATIDCNPNTLNLKSNGKWIACYIELSKDYDVLQIDGSDVYLNEIPAYLGKQGWATAESNESNIKDYDKNEILERMVKFDRQAVQEILEAGEQTLTLTGRIFYNAGLVDFEGRDIVKVIEKK